LAIREKMRMNRNLSGSNQGRQGAVLCKPVLSRKQQGFTLIEVIIVMAIMAIVAVIAIPSFSDNIEKQAVRNAAQALLSHLKQARVRALAENRVVSIKFGVDAAGNVANAYVFDAGTTGVERKVTVMYSGFSKNLSLTKKNSTLKPNTLNFKSRGTVGSTTIDFCSAGFTKRITINQIGRARLCLAADTTAPCSDPHLCP